MDTFYGAKNSGVLHIGHKLISIISTHWYWNTFIYKNNGHIIKDNVYFYLEIQIFDQNLHLIHYITN